ncbi:similar to Saccharomyces cerevisiae YAL013W DEP1 Transcriptional modulator involved in regulation of structural phospholipid biosynthesis genes and metabolically unrelated genes [Maudiozyma saulgeensis]|uniref:Similar to Saccharomyces cerevisiae YAL013W DEP1 Transcriptional modulator involved in regulation of structural phospholipid biosynthesis genes and metabolically unrelated genes n=1 Tax=Maudiozyma saulgeensis TaxID=1789683 RepID=A0A1X7R8A7_9SACH|nr:similar to Saccharomyces cerevisiae YAL013W DEP1 Transcriptional modulator involved in regulation of structural phospholipid biosynthesis genes and metabolically unrelated genes [Kazachstania saulgeensis]
MSDTEKKETTTRTEDLNVDNLALHNTTSRNSNTPNPVSNIPPLDTNSEIKEHKKESSPIRRLKEDDEESALTNIDYTNQEVSEELGRNLNLSDYCISSDADTEKMDSDTNENGVSNGGVPPRLAALIPDEPETIVKPLSEDIVEEDTIGNNKRSLEETEPEEENKKLKIDPSQDTISPNIEEEDHIEVGNEGDEEEDALDDALEDEEEDEVDDTRTTPAVPDKTPSVDEVNKETLLTDIVPVQNNDKNMGLNETEIEVETTKEINSETKTPTVEETVLEPENAETPSIATTIATVKTAPVDIVENTTDVKEEKEDEEPEEEEQDVEDEDEVEDEMEEEEENTGDSEQTRQEALTDITAIEYQFAELRQKLYETKLYKLELELQMCLEGSHPELRGYYEKIASIRDYKLRRAYQRQRYELKCIDTETRATRTFIHQGYHKRMCDTKNKLLDNTTQRWYDINKERRDMDIVVPEVHYHVPIKTADKTLSCITGYAGPARLLLPGEPISEDLQCENIEFRYRNNPVDKLEVIVDRMRLNNELSDLEGLKKYYYGFPGAPSLNSLRDSEINDDFEVLHQQLQRLQHPQTLQSPPQ